MKKLLMLLVSFWGVGAAGLWYWNDPKNHLITFKTVPVKRGDLMVTINATGTLEPEEVVDIGAQIVGQIRSFGTDPRDPSLPIGYGTAVEEGTVLARLDEAVLRARVDSARAQLARAEADVELTRVKYRQAENAYDRVKKLNARGSAPAQELDTARFELEAAKANIAVLESAVPLAKAALEEASVNLGYAIIRSPVKGVIVDRRVNIGQTVVASLNAPSLFLIAKDLKKMEIWASVNETDIGSIHVDQSVRFTVSAHPGETFRGKVSQIRLNASMTQSVVTYTVVVAVENSSGKLLPYLTARLHFEVEERKAALLVPNAALRWQPRVQNVAPEHRPAYAELIRRNEVEKETPNSKRAVATSVTRDATLWMRDDEFVRPVPVKTGMTDGFMTEILSDKLTDGSAIVVGQTDESAAPAAQSGEPDAKSPFLPDIKNGKATK